MKAQASIEFLILVVILAMLSIFLLLENLRMIVYINIEDVSDTFQHLCYRISKEVELAYLIGDGYERNFTLPTKVKGNEYSIAVEDNFISISWKNSTVSCPVVSAINGTFVTGKNTIKNLLGVIYVNK